ncbi:Ubiquitin-conjugating enzyme E2 H [Fasciola hepatica]|uniref:Ubiquitin-conjugating enzyme E2 H n=1 Tax=Fasciola hepatica TaxID=6192 RepID=A0A4E0RHE5_FASHE|nr:Ubiquitin-conjugating enzyme E2 H [Fasciola hepatica]
MCSPSPGKKRMNTDVIKLMESNHEVTVLGASNELMVKFFGPAESGIWKVRVDLPERYPFKSPSIDLTNIFESFLPQLLAYPNPTDPLNSDAASLFMFKPSEYVLKVKEYVQRFATEEVLKAEENGGPEPNSSDDESSMSDYTDDMTKDMEL